MPDDDWYRSRTWSEDIAARFEQRLSRARTQRCQYLAIQGGILAYSDSADLRRTGRALLRRVISDYPDHFDAKSACETIGRSYQKDGRLQDSADSLRAAVAMCEASPIGYSGTSGTPDLHLAEVLLEMGGHAQEAADILEAGTTRILDTPMVVTRYRFYLAFARALHSLSHELAPELAQRALEAADQTEPVFRFHPTVGIPDSTADEIRELQRIAGLSARPSGINAWLRIRPKST